MPRIEIRNRLLAEKFVSSEPWAAISISNELNDVPKIQEENRVGWLKLSFDDRSNPKEAADPELGKKYISKEQAQQILQFVDEVWDKVETILIHCHGGFCRSPAVGAAIERLKGRSDFHYFDGRRFTPNTYVYRMIIQTAQDQM